jgi:small-conductance mechanosensitive channel
MQVDWSAFVRRLFSEEAAFAFSVAILVVGLVAAYLVWRWTRRLLTDSGFADAVEGTPFERTLRAVGSSSAGLIALLVAVFVYVLAIVVALNVAQLLDIQLFWTRLTGYLPRLLVAALAVIIGVTAGYRAELAVDERLRSVKLPEVDFLGDLVKYSIFYVAGLVALAQIGVATSALLVLLGAYAFGLVFLGGLAFRHLLAASAAGIYLLLTEPYAIGDEVRIDDRRGIVQEMDVFVTRVESEGEEYIIPNQQVVQSGVVRVRE